MKNKLLLVIGIVLATFLLAKMFMFQVRYDEVAVVTTFNEARAGSLVVEPGPKPRWPFPIQSVTKYSKRIKILETRSEEQPTRDRHNLIVASYVAWRIEDPLAFFTKLDNVKTAEAQIDSQVRDLRSIIGRYSLDELVNTDPTKIKLREVEKKMQEALATALKNNGYGIAIEQVGIHRMELPESVTTTVFERMRDERETLAENELSSGRARAATIKSNAESTRDRILAYAGRYADAIRAEGDKESAKHHAVFAQDENFAIFLRKLRTIPDLIGGDGKTIFVPSSWLELINRPVPDVAQKQ